ncbi:MAG: carbohydrate ABC transporter permease [Clostridia bacterium]|nr:carbohydrate ABC transporter permease [Clostridia bacterium]
MTNAIRKRKNAGSHLNRLISIGLGLLSLVYVYPFVMVLLNSFKKKIFISRMPFALPDHKTFAGIANYQTGIARTDFPKAMVHSVMITVLPVLAILLFTSMCAWYLNRVRNRMTRLLYRLFILSMVVPFQMVMFTLSKIANVLRLNTPVGIVPVYLGFGAGLSVFLFFGYMKSCPIAMEESAMIDGAKPLRVFFSVVLPILQPCFVSVGILQAMWIWNDYLLPYLVLDLKRFKTIPIAVQYLKGGYGSVDMGAMMAMLVLAILPIVVVYLFCQKYIVSGVMAGAVKG